MHHNTESVTGLSTGSIQVTGRVTPNMLCLSKTEIMNQSPGRAEGAPENFPGIPVTFTGNFIPGDFIISVVNFVI